MSKGQLSFFVIEEQLEKIYKNNSFLPKLNTLVDWEIFRSDLMKIRDKERKSNAGAPSFDVVLMFKILVLKSMYNLSDDKTEEQIRDRLSFRDFLGLTFADKVPDAKTIWAFAEQLKNHGLETELFDRFDEELDRQGFSAKGGLIVDGTFVEVPKQRNSRDENAQIKNGEIPQTFSKNPNVLEQKDVDARWTQKGNEDHFGYKDHAVIDVTHKLIRGYGVTDAAVNDIILFEDVVPEVSPSPDEPYFADAGYVGAEREKRLRERGYDPQVCERIPKTRPLLIPEVKENNRQKSKIRCRIEHVFGEMKMRMGDETLRTIGFARARFWIGMRNLAYNMSRLITLNKSKKQKARG
jgi:Transposase and inactivated derivatives, IS5 family